MSENIYGAAYVKSLEKNMFTSGELYELMSQSIEEIYHRLSERGYSGKDVREMIDSEEEKTARLCVNLCEDEDIQAVMLAKADFHNIKTLVKYAITKKGGKSLMKAPTNVDLEEIMQAFEKYAHNELSDLAKEVFDRCKKGGIAKVDRFCDSLMQHYIAKKGKTSEFVAGWVELFLKKSAEKEGFLKDWEAQKQSASEFFKACDDEITEYLKGAQFFFFSDDAIFAYFWGKSIELQNLRLILCGKRYGNMEYVRERLRKTYV